MITSANDIGKIDQPDKQNDHLMHLLVRSCPKYIQIYVSRGSGQSRVHHLDCEEERWIASWGPAENQPG